MNRRQFLGGSLAGLSGLMFPMGKGTAQETTSGTQDSWISGYGTDTGSFGVARIDENLNVIAKVKTPFRLHDVIFNPDQNEVCLPARRPGDICLILRSTINSLSIRAPSSRHFYGHGTYSADGRYLYLTENDYEKGEGVVSIYDAKNAYARIGEINSGGIGPHEILRYPDNGTLVVANGGIQTHPGSGRAKLNLDTMRPNISIIDPKARKLIARIELPEEMMTLSLRHIDVKQDGSVYFGLQDQYPGLEDYPLVGHWRPGSAITFVPSPPGGWQQFNGYVGSVRTDNSEKYLAASGPRGGVTCFWPTHEDRISHIHSMNDVCGIESTRQENQFLVTSGTGMLAVTELSEYGPETQIKKQLPFRFDNHCRKGQFWAA